MTNVYLVDASAIVQLPEPEVAAVVGPLLVDGSAATCGLIELALLGRMMDAGARTEVSMTRRAAFRWLPTDDDLRRALEVQASLLKDGYHGAGLRPLVVAAVAERHGVIVMHRDAAFDRIAKVTGQPVRWVGPESGVR